METLEEKLNLVSLLDVYGGLLTERQRHFFDLHFNEDLSYGEIAEMENISRQAVHDTIQHGKKALIRFEEELHLVEKSKTSDLQSIPDEQNMESIRALIGEISRLVKDDIIYDTGPLRKNMVLLRQKLGLKE